MELELGLGLELALGLELGREPGLELGLELGQKQKKMQVQLHQTGTPPCQHRQKQSSTSRGGR